MDLTYYRNLMIEIRKEEKFEVLLAESGGASEACYKRMDAFKENKPHGFMVLFSIDCRASFENVENWVSEVRIINQSAYIILVACKSDLRQCAHTNQDLVGKEEIKEKCQRLNLQRCVETSALAHDNRV